MGKMYRKLVGLTLTLVMVMGLSAVCAANSVGTDSDSSSTIPTETSYKNDIIVAAKVNSAINNYLKLYNDAIPQNLLPVNVPITEWTGKQFFILALSEAGQSQGYLDLVFASNAQKLPYTYAGRKMVADKVVPLTNSTNDYEVFFTDLETGEKYIGLSMRESISSIGYLDDLKKVTEFFPGRTVYARSNVLLNIEDTLPDPNSKDFVMANFGQEMKVIEIWQGMAYEYPFYLVVEVNGQRAALSFAYSYTNQPINTWSGFPITADRFFIVNPLSYPDWTQTTLDEINKSEVKVGMDMLQVYYSWGRPSRIENTYDLDGNPIRKAFYADKVLTFSAGILIDISTMK